jgi:hypothetical protein
MYIDMQLELALILFYGGSMNSDNVANMLYLGTILSSLSVENTTHMLIVLLGLVASTVVGVIDYLNCADVFVSVFRVVG